MLKLLLVLVAVVGVAIVAILVLAAAKPATFHVERSTTIAATPEKIHPLVDDFHNWEQWSPWAHLDPNMQVSYSGATAGPGAVYEWQGNSKVGKGRMEILAVEPTATSIKLDFLKPFESHNHSTFALQPEGSGTRVTWTMDGPNTFVSKLMSVFVSMDAMIGKDFDAGLGNLKTAAERS
jgi:uncharacterized protein YndB with AHSA1/START domain